MVLPDNKAVSAANSSCLFLYNNASEWEPAGCYRGDYNLTCDNTTQTLSNTSGVFHGRQGRCSQGGASAPDGADPRENPGARRPTPAGRADSVNGGVGGQRDPRPGAAHVTENRRVGRARRRGLGTT